VLGLTAPHTPVDPTLLDTPGAFLWWYLDLVGDDGQGLVLIWSWGLPFLPGLASAARRGAPQLPRDRPSINLAIYEQGRPSYYLFHEVDPADAAWCPSAGRWRIGATEIRATPGPGGTLRVTADLDLPVPGAGERLVGRVQAAGTLRQADGPDAGDPRHQWAPLLAAARGSIDARCGRQRFGFEGRAYHDRNAGQQPMHELGIDRWWWGRLAFPGRELIWYHLAPEDPAEPMQTLVIEVTADGRTRQVADAAVEISRARRSLFGLQWPTELRFADPDGRVVVVHLTAGVDDSPFYQRMLVEAQCDGERARGVAELVVPGAVDPDWMRWLVTMRVHREGGDNSVWLPLFTGPRGGRLGRLLGQLVPGRPAIAQVRP
jgi:carotenoid 1,2-hydratase